MLKLKKTHSRHQAYKPSGIEWIWEIPEGWEIRRINQLSNVRRWASPRPIDDPIYFDENGEYAWTRIADVSASNKYLFEAPQKLSDLWKSLSVPLEPGEIFVSIAGTVGKPIISGIKCCIHDGFVYFPKLKYDKELLYWIFIGWEAYKGLWKLWTQLNLNSDTIGNISIPLPSEKEQKEIVAFLNQKTILIDEAIGKKRRQIELLNERRTALINRAVTKGLDPNVKMKDSGIEWIWEIPEGWETKRLKHLTKNVVRKVEHTTASFTVAMENIESWTWKYVKPEANALFEGDMNIFRSGDVLFGKLRPYLAKVYETRCDWLCVGEFFVLSPEPEIDSSFLKYRLVSADFIEQVNGSTFGSKMPRADWWYVGMLSIPYPLIEEQKDIASYLDEKTALIDEIVLKIERSIELLTEYRTSLISNVVTGKIRTQ